MRISDPKAIRALAHPLRLDLIELLGVISPATAAQCGRVLGEPQASCSFHLRQLAKYGFVEEAGPGADKRERLWRVTDRHFAVPDGEGEESIAVDEYRQFMVAREAERISGYQRRRAEEPEEWRKAGGMHASTLALTADEAAELRQVWRDAIAPYAARAEAEGAKPGPGERLVRFFLAASPLTDLDLGE